MTPFFYFWHQKSFLLSMSCLLLVWMVQTCLLLGPGVWALHILQKRKSGACTLLGRLLLCATLALVVLSISPALGGKGRAPVLWNVRLPLSPQLSVSGTNENSASPENLPSASSFSTTSPSPFQSNGKSPSARRNSAIQTPQSALNVSPVASPVSALLTAKSSIGGGTTTAMHQLVATIWLSGATLILLGLGFSHGALWRMRRKAIPLLDVQIVTTLHRVCRTLQVPPPSLLYHPQVSSPFLTGLLQPVIMLPASKCLMSEEALEAVLLHEIAHKKRHDLWWNALGRVLCAVLWFQPLLWGLCRQLENSSEVACDGAVLQAGCAPSLYATCLLDWAQSQMPRRAQRIAGIGVLPGRSSLAQRVRFILEESSLQKVPLSRRLCGTMIGSTIVAVVALPLLVASNPPEQASRAPQQTPPTSQNISPPDAGGTRQPLQNFIESDGYRLFIRGVSKGVLQGVTLIHEQRDGGTLFILAHTMRRQVTNGEVTDWLMENGRTYTSKRETGLESESTFGRMSLHFSSSPLNKFLDQQLNALDQPLNVLQWKQIQSDFAPPMEQFNALETWGKANGNAALTGRVLNEEGAPVAGIKVEVQISEQALQGITHSPKSEGYGRIYSYIFALPKTTRDLLNQNVKTQSDGTYRFEGLGAAPYKLDIAPYGRMTRFHFDVPPPAQVLTASHQVVPKANQTISAPDLVLTRGGMVRVLVQDKDNGSLLPGVEVSASSKKGSPPYDYGHFVSVDTDDAGKSLFRLPAGAGSIAIGEEFLQQLHGFATPSKKGIYKRNDRAEAVVDGGAPQPFDGAVEVQVTPNQTREVVIRLQHFVAPTPTPVPRPLPPPAGKGTLLGRVVNEAGEGVGGVPVFAHIQQQAQWRLMQGAGLANSNNETPNFDRKWASISKVLGQSTTTQADGSFRLNGLTTAPYNLLIVTSNGSFGLKPPAGLVATAAEGVWAKEGQIVRRTKPLVVTRGALIEGRILDKATGLPLGGINIASNGPQLPLSTDDVMTDISDKEGKFSLRVAPGTTSLYIAGPWNNNSAVYADDGKSADNEARIVTSRGLFAGSGNVPFEIDGGPSQLGLNVRGRNDGRIEISLEAGQTRRLTLHLRRLKPKK